MNCVSSAHPQFRLAAVSVHRDESILHCVARFWQRPSQVKHHALKKKRKEKKKGGFQMLPAQDAPDSLDPHVDFQNVDFNDELRRHNAALPPPVIQILGPRDFTRQKLRGATDVAEMRKVVSCTNTVSHFSKDVPDFSQGLQELMKKQISVPSDVPDVALPFYAEAVMVCSDALRRYPGNKSFALYLMLPRLLLWSRRSVSELSRAKYVA
jgi:hypothetical protein